MSIDWQYKNKSGIYKITTKTDDRVYIGSAHCLYTRVKVHFTLLRQGTHCNSKLQRFVNKYGVDNIEFTIVELCEKDRLLEREQYYIDSLCPYFNLCPLARNSAGYKFTEEQLKKLSDIRKGVYPEHLRNTNNTPEARLKISIKAKQRGLHPNFKEASILANTGCKQTREHRRKIALKQMKITPEQVIEIRHLLSLGIFQKDIALMFGVSQRVICRINTKVGIYEEL